MTYPSAKTVTFVHRQVTGQDAYGNDVYTDVVTEAQAVYDPGGSTEVTAGRDTVTTQPTLYGVPTGIDLSAVDAVLVDGLRFQIDGEPTTWPANPFSGWVPNGGASGVVHLRRVSG